MAPPVGTQIAVPGFFYEGQRASPNLSQFREHCVFFTQEVLVQGYGRLQADHTYFRKREGQAKPLQHRSVLWLLLKNPVGCGDHRALHGHYMGDEFGGRPGALPGTCSPEVAWDSISRPQQAVLRAVQFLEDRFEPRHDPFGQRRYSAAPPACSKARANCRTRPSPKGGPKICNPTGSFPQTLPQGTEIPGTPAREPVTV